jgi:hypothetical protein
MCSEGGAIVTSLDARALVSEIRQRLESPDTVRPARFKEERYDDGETTGTQRVCTTCGRVQVYGGESHNKGCVDYRRALDCQDFKEGAKRLLTAALGLIEQQQWQPIETWNGKDATPVLTCSRHRDGFWCDPAVLYRVNGKWRTKPDVDPLAIVYWQPCVWMPLPEPPSLVQQTKSRCGATKQMVEGLAGCTREAGHHSPHLSGDLAWE